VGGVGDVVAALPPALARLGWSSTVLMPGYGALGALPGSRTLGSMKVAFGGDDLDVDVYEVPTVRDGVDVILFEHPNFSPDGPGKIYCDDGPDRPFATDAGKFALFSAACATFIDRRERPPDVVHLHDWHAAFFCLLRQFEPRYRGLRDVRTVFTIHNLAMQGIRPLAGDPSSLASWYPALDYDRHIVADTRYPDCINPMAAAIRLADRVSTVSPTYATEILRPNDEPHGFHGGEGLEDILHEIWADGRLFGILNGCDYPKQDRRKPGWRRLLDSIDAELSVWRDRDRARAAALETATERLAGFPKRRPRHLLTNIGRLTAQKVALFLEMDADGGTVLDGILADIRPGGVFIMLGSGDPALERRFAAACRQHDNFLFLPGYAEDFADLLYRAGDLFLMPSSFEPCGISQMLAMRAGQPCIVHAVGGLRDTVRDNVTGFAFEGDSPFSQARMFRETVKRALETRQHDESRWLMIREAARAARFTWDASAMQYIGELYE
jgi:starch synthase